MGRAGIKRRKGNKPQHLPKVGTPKEEHYALHEEQRAVVGNMGVRGNGWAFWVAIVLIVAIVAGGLLALIFFT
jgi:hypothetical protein